jgi:hypothetical protein
LVKTGLYDPKIYIITDNITLNSLA